MSPEPLENRKITRIKKPILKKSISDEFFRINTLLEVYSKLLNFLDG